MDELFQKLLATTEQTPLRLKLEDAVSFGRLRVWLAKRFSNYKKSMAVFDDSLNSLSFCSTSKSIGTEGEVMATLWLGTRRKKIANITFSIIESTENEG